LVRPHDPEALQRFANNVTKHGIHSYGTRSTANCIKRIHLELEPSAPHRLPAIATHPTLAVCGPRSVLSRLIRAAQWIT
jgi:hypothetical protein